MLSRRSLLLFFTLLYSQLIFAQSSFHKPFFHPPVVKTSKKSSSTSFFSALQQGHFVFQAGAFRSSQGQAQHIDIVDLIGDEFTVSQPNDWNGLVGLGYFIKGHRLSQVQLNYGINFFYLPKTSVSGIVIQENVFSNLSYNYEVTNYPLYAAVKATSSLPFHGLCVTLDAGIGPNFIRTSDFTEHSLDGGITIPDNIFSGRTTTTFSATAGIGLEFGQVIDGMSLECGYRFFYLGEGNFSKNTDQVISTLQTGPAYGNAILFTLHI